MSEWLNGKKTYLSCAGGGLAFTAYLLGWIDANTFEKVATLCGFAGLAALRSGVSKGA